MTSKDEPSDDDDGDDDDDDDDDGGGQVNADDNAELQLATTGDAIWTVQDAQGNDVQFEAARCKAIEAAFASGSKEYRFSACFDGQHSFDYTISLEPSAAGKAFYQRNDQTGKRRLVSRFRVVGGEMVPSLSLSRVDLPSQANPRLSRSARACPTEDRSPPVARAKGAPSTADAARPAPRPKTWARTRR